MENLTNSHFVSIVIPARNEENHIGKCLKAIEELEFPKNQFEIILVDNGSTDRTLEIAKGFNVKVFTKLNGTIGALRNFGCQNSSGEIIAFIDADCQASRSWLKNAIKYFNDKNIAAVGSRLIHLELTWVAKCWAMMHSEKNFTGDTDWLPSGNMIVSRKKFEEIDGFDEKLKTSEDYDLCLRLRLEGYKIISDPEISSVHLNPPKTLLEFYEKERWHGKEMWSVFLKKRGKISRALIYGVFCLFCELGILGGIGVVLFTGKYQILVLFTFIFLLAPISLSIKTAWHSKRYRYVFPLSLIHLVYGIGRSASLFGTKD